MSERNDDNDDDIDNTKFFSAFTQSILNSDKSIRWVGITDQDGNIIPIVLARNLLYQIGVLISFHILDLLVD